MVKEINFIRDILRKDGITGMDSINHCIVFLVSRILDKKLCEKLEIDKKYAFKNILKDEHGEELGDQDFKAKIINKSGNNFIHVMVNKLGFKNIKFKLESPQNLKLIYEKLKELDTDNLSTKYDLIGTIYELHLKSGTSNSMRDLGQYYTHRLVINYMIELCEPKMKDGVIEKIVDPTMGTGGFLTMSIKYLNQKYKDKINWKKNKDNIIGFDIDDNVKNMALLNILLEIGELCKDTIIKQDTLHSDMKFKDGKFDGTVLEKADVILANEPMGLKSLKFKDFCERIKELKISGTKAEPAFLQLFMGALNDNGRCAVIIPDGVLFNESNQHQGTRQYLIENFNLHKVVSLNDDFFLNTGVKTSILFFTKDGNKTKKVDFCEIKLKNGEIEENSIIKVKYSKIKEANYSLFVNKYNATETEKIEGIEYKKIGDICDLLPTTKHTSSIGKENGMYRFYNSSQENKLYLDTYEVDKESIIIGNGGNLCIHYDKTFTPSKHVTVCQTTHKNINLKYIYYHLTLNSEVLKEKSAGSTIQWLNKTSINSIEIPIPALAIQEAIVERLDVLNGSIEESKQIVDKYRKIIKYYVDCQTKNEKEEIIDNIFDMVIGKKTTKEMNENGTYEFYNGSAESPVGKLPDYSYDNKEHYILLIKDGGAGQGKYGDKIGLGKSFYVNGKTAFTTSVVALINKNPNKCRTKYLYHYLVAVKNDLMDLAQYTTGLGHLTTGRLKKFSMRIPSKEKQKEIVEYCDNLSDIINKIEQQIKDNKDFTKYKSTVYKKSMYFL